MDLYNREIVAYTISDCQYTDFVLDTFNQLNVPQGGPSCIATRALFTPQKPTFRPAQKKSIIRSMFRKGTPADNACIEWFHSALKSETFYLHHWRNLTKDSITDIVKNDITFYNEIRIQQRLNDQSPVQYRKLAAWKVFFFFPLWGCSAQLKCSFCLIMWLSVRLAPLGARQINHPFMIIVD